ncbi:MAG: GreA/GreB family elongation factor [Nitriliruptorales bacterium]
MAEKWLSQEAHDRLQSELHELRTEGRTRISEVIQEARSHGDLRENAEYDAAKDEQGKMEARIRQLEALLREARVGAPPKSDTVGPGLVVTLEIGGDEETYFISDTREERHAEHDVLSTASPIGRAVVGARAGETVTAEVPAGQLKVTVKEIHSS